MLFILGRWPLTQCVAACAGTLFACAPDPAGVPQDDALVYQQIGRIIDLVLVAVVSVAILFLYVRIIASSLHQMVACGAGTEQMLRSIPEEIVRRVPAIASYLQITGNEAVEVPCHPPCHADRMPCPLPPLPWPLDAPPPRGHACRAPPRAARTRCHARGLPCVSAAACYTSRVGAAGLDWIGLRDFPRYPAKANANTQSRDMKKNAPWQWRWQPRLVGGQQHAALRGP